MRWDLALLALRLRLATPTPAALPGNRGAGSRLRLTEPPWPRPLPRGARPAPSAAAPGESGLRRFRRALAGGPRSTDGLAV